MFIKDIPLANNSGQRAICHCKLSGARTGTIGDEKMGKRRGYVICSSRV